METIKDPELIAEYKKLISEAPSLTKENSTFDDWFSEVIRLYSLGSIDEPMTAMRGKMPFWEHLCIPTEEMVENYRKDDRIIDLYKDLYEDGKIPSLAINLMW